MKSNVEQTEEQQRIIALRDEAIGGFDRMRPQFKALEAGYMAIIDEGQRTSLRKRRKSTLNPAMIRPKVAKVVRDVMRSFFGADELCQISPETGENENDLKTSEILKKELDEYARDENLYAGIKPAVRSAIVYGTAAVKCYWSVAENTVKIENVKLGKVYLDPHAQNADGIRYLVHKIESRTIGELKKQFPKAKIDWAGIEQLHNQTEELGEYRRITIYDVYRLHNGVWTVSTVADDIFIRTDVKLKDGLPFIIPTIDEQFELLDESSVLSYGDSLIAPLLPIQTEYVIRRNQQIDAIDLQLNQRFLTTSTSGLREEDLNSNRKRLVVQSLNEIKELPAPRIDQAIFDTDKLEGEAQDVFGISKLSQGLNDKKNLNQTATGISILTQEGSTVIDDINRAFNEALFRPLFNRIVRLIYKYKVSERFAQINRNQPLRQKVVIDVGIGSTNKEIKMGEVDGAQTAVANAIPVFIQVGAAEEAAKYTKVLGRLLDERIKLLGFNSILEEIKEEAAMAQSQSPQPAPQIQPQQQGTTNGTI